MRGPAGREEGALESALARPKQRLNYDAGAGLVELASSYGSGLAHNHPFNDGNERMAFVTMAVFLELNGLRFDASEAEVVITMRALAAGEITEDELVEWLRENVALGGSP